MVAPRQLERLFDLRTVRRNIRGGLITKERYEEWLKNLPDATGNVATVSLEDEEREARRQQPAPRFPVISPTRPLVSAPFDEDDEDDDYDDDDDDDDDDGDADSDSDGDGDAAAAPETPGDPGGDEG
jgi:hypothetical protein